MSGRFAFERWVRKLQRLASLSPYLLSRKSWAFRELRTAWHDERFAFVLYILSDVEEPFFVLLKRLAVAPRGRR